MCYSAAMSSREGPTLAPMQETRPRAATAFEVHGAALRQLLGDLQIGFRQLLDGRELGFTPVAQASTVEGDLTLRSEGGMLPGNLGGYAELEIASASSTVGARQTIRLSQGKSDAFVAVQLDYLLPVSPAPAVVTAADALGSVISRWAGRYKFTSRRGALLNHVVHVDTAQRCAELSDHIISDEREVCIVVVTEQFKNVAPACDLDALTAKLAGFAIVCMLSQEYTRRLGENLGGRLYAVFDGAVRVFRPQYRSEQATDAYEANPLILGEDVRAMSQRGAFAQYVFDRVQEQQADRYLAPRADFKHLRRLLTNKEFQGDAEASAKLSALELGLAYADAQQVIHELRERINHLEADVRDARAARTPTTDLIQAPDLDELLVDAFANIPEVEIWSTAIASASACGGQMYVGSTVTKAFEAITEYARTLAAKPDFQLGQQPYYWFRNRGLSYKATESQSTLAIHGQSRQWTECGVTREVQSHVTLNPNTDRCVQLYFEADEKARKVNVVYLGPHLPTATQTHNN